MSPWVTNDDGWTARGLEIIGDGVRTARHQAELTQQQLGRLAEVSQSLISRLETGRVRGMGIRKLARVVGALESELRVAPPILAGVGVAPPMRRRPYPVDDPADPVDDLEADDEVDGWPQARETAL